MFEFFHDVFIIVGIRAHYCTKFTSDENYVVFFFNGACEAVELAVKLLWVFIATRKIATRDSSLREISDFFAFFKRINPTPWRWIPLLRPDKTSVLSPILSTPGTGRWVSDRPMVSHLYLLISCTSTSFFPSLSGVLAFRVPVANVVLKVKGGAGGVRLTICYVGNCSCDVASRQAISNLSSGAGRHIVGYPGCGIWFVGCLRRGRWFVGCSGRGRWYRKVVG